MNFTIQRKSFEKYVHCIKDCKETIIDIAIREKIDIQTLEIALKYFNPEIRIDTNHPDFLVSKWKKSRSDTRLTVDIIEKVKELYNQNTKPSEISNQLEIRPRVVFNIITGKKKKYILKKIFDFSGMEKLIASSEFREKLLPKLDKNKILDKRYIFLEIRKSLKVDYQYDVSNYIFEKLFKLFLDKKLLDY